LTEGDSTEQPGNLHTIDQLVHQRYLATDYCYWFPAFSVAHVL